MMTMLLDWPEHKGDKPVTTALNQAIFKAAAAAAAHELPNAVAEFQDALTNCGSTGSGNWRRDYRHIVEKFVHIQAAASPETVVQMCQAGLDCATASFVMRSQTSADGDDDDGDSSMIMSIPQAFENIAQYYEPLQTETYTGTNKPAAAKDLPLKFQLASPHDTDDSPLWVTGDEAVAQIKAWKDYGCMEESAFAHAAAVCRSDNVTEYVENKTFCLLGITSEMGPARHLLKIPGAHVMGVARAGSKLESLKNWFQQNGPESTTLQVASANLLEHAPAIARWIVETAAAADAAANKNPLHHQNKQQSLVLVPLAYMDGEANVRVTVAMDAIVQYVMQHCRCDDVSLAYLTSPTTIYTIPNDAALDAKRRYYYEEPPQMLLQTSSWTWTSKLVRAASFGSWLQPSNTWKQLIPSEEDGSSSSGSTNKPVVYNGAYHLQGPNYCLAKMMQQWRCIVAHYNNNNITVCAPHAPGTRTWSVLHNPSAAVAVEGMPYFAPLLTFDVLPCSSLLTAILLHQLSLQQQHCGGSTSSSSTSKEPRKEYYAHPLQLFWDGAVHGGAWRCPYSSDSILALTYVLGKVVAKPGWCPAAALAPKPEAAHPS